jgi:hypothetical protein
MENKQTAVEYLVKEFSAILGPIKTEAMQDLLLVDAIEQAKQMEREQQYETKAYWFGRGILAGKEDRIEELKPTRD